MVSAALTKFFTFLLNVAKWILDGALFVIKSFVFLLFDGLLTCISALFTAIDFSNYIARYALSWAGLPEQFIWIMTTISVPAGIVMICAAIGIRMLINLIPSWATRL